MITCDEKVVAIWFINTTETQDWMACLREVKPEEEYELIYRFRYYKDDKAFDSEDEKSWYKGRITGTRAYVLASTRAVAKIMEEFAAGKLYELVNEGDYEAFVKKFMDAPFVYAKQVSKEEYEKHEKEATT